MVKALRPEYIAPVVAYLCHESSAVNGELFELGAGWVARVRWQRSKGHSFPLTGPIQPEDVVANWAKIEDFSDPTYPLGPSVRPPLPLSPLALSAPVPHLTRVRPPHRTRSVRSLTT
jgi:hypothetical protein